MREKFRDAALSDKNLAQVYEINKIIREYEAEGYTLTLRQLYYQLVSRDMILNEQKEYSKLSHLVTEGRMAGLIDWEAIEDRTREPKIPYYADSPAAAVRDVLRQYRRNRQENQDCYIEVWVEKDALSGVLSRITEKFHVRLMVNRGYSSCSAMYEAAQRIKDGLDGPGVCEAYILYLGDHDPSGLDMVRDIKSRLEEFGQEPEIIHLGLTDEQVEKYSPPPNPAKMTDTRAAAYIAKYGRTCWEVDALNPKILNKLVEDAIEELINAAEFKRTIDRERDDITELTRIADRLDKKR